MQIDVAETWQLTSVGAMASYPSRCSSVAMEAFILLFHEDLFPYFRYKFHHSQVSKSRVYDLIAAYLRAPQLTTSSYGAHYQLRTLELHVYN